MPHPKTVFALALLAAWDAARAQTPNAIDVDVRGLRNGHGRVDCYLYASADGFPGDIAKAQERTTAPILGGAARCRFDGVAPGAYAIAVVHDERSTGKLERNFMGIPTQGIGASNDAAGHFGPPSFASARFAYAGGEKSLVVHVRYLL
jgi:uncharacterized protein (DUF2141 family)